MFSVLTRHLIRNTTPKIVRNPVRLLATNQPNVQKVELKDESPKSIADDDDIPFETLLRNSPFMWLGDFDGRIIEGTIYQVFGDDLYIDFGGKFHCVCRRPRNGTFYVRGAKVKLRLNDWELAARFLGSSRDMTLMEADCTLLGLISSPAIDSTKEE